MVSQTDDTAAAIEAAKKVLADAEDAHAAALADAPPREPAVILEDFMAKVAQRFGNHHELASLLAEYRKANAPA